MNEFINRFKNETTETNKKEASWSDIIAPPCITERGKVIIILGSVGSGKSALAYFLAEKLLKEYDLLGVVVNLPEDKAHLLPDKFVIRELDEIETMENSVVIIDEGTSKLPAGSKLEDMIKGFSSLGRQRNQVIIFIFHSSRDAGSRILRGVGPILVKEPSRRQIQYGSKDRLTMELLNRAKEKFGVIAEMGDDVRKYTYVDCEYPNFEGIMKNDIPSFWSEELSKVWKGSGKVVEPKVYKDIQSFLAGLEGLDDG